jgi:hypothetical protein
MQNLVGTSITNMSKYYTQTAVPQSTRLAVRDLLTFNDCVYNKHTQLTFVFSKAPMLPLGPTHSPSQWVPEALSSAGKSPGSDAIPPLAHPPSWRSRGLLYLYYERYSHIHNQFRPYADFRKSARTLTRDQQLDTQVETQDK